ncbi:ABC transporter permease [Candidatus Bathyarchaeota archaeon]|nr:MAG: ABC transporter permease [Candidatus Bathyarchaeota archaeon]
MGLRGYLVKRSINTVILILFVITLNFVIFELLPGTQGSVAGLAENPKIPPERKQQFIDSELTRYGLLCGYDSNHNPIPCSVWERFGKYFWAMVTFNFGNSFQTGDPITQDMIQSGRLANTLLLIGVSSVIALALGIFLGVISAKKRGSFIDSTMVTTSLVTFSLPTFWMAMVLVLVFVFWLNPTWPASGVTPANWIDPKLAPTSIWQVIPVRLQYLFLPALTLTLFQYGGHLLLTRATMLEALSEDYITTARAKGLPERTVLYKHALKNASLPIVTSAALNFGFILSGAIITETVFAWDGLGYWLYNAINWKDIPVMQAMFFIIALCVIVANFGADVLYGLLDPRIKYE